MDVANILLLASTPHGSCKQPLKSPRELCIHSFKPLLVVIWLMDLYIRFENNILEGRVFPACYSIRASTLSHYYVLDSVMIFFILIHYLSIGLFTKETNYSKNSCYRCLFQTNVKKIIKILEKRSFLPIFNKCSPRLYSTYLLYVSCSEELNVVLDEAKGHPI